MKTLEKAKLLADKMEKLGEYANLEVKSVFTPMDEPIGYAIGNTLEIIEAINFLQGKEMPEDLEKIVLELGSQMIKLAGLGDNIDVNKKMMINSIENGLAFKKFKEMVKNQGGDVSYLEDTNKFEKAQCILEVRSRKNGVIKEINAEDIGRIAGFLGAGRVKKDDKIDMSAGIVLNKKVNDVVKENDCLCTVYCGNKEKAIEAVQKLDEIFKIG